MRSTAVAALLLVVGAACGSGITFFLRPETNQPPPHPREPDSPSPPASPPAGPGTSRIADGPPVTPSAAPSGPAGAEAADFGALGVRPDEQEFVRGALLRERARREALRLDPALPGIEAMRRVLDSGADPMSLLANFDAVRARVRVEGTRRTVDVPAQGTALNLPATAEGAAILEFGPGTFVIDPQSREWLSLREGARSLEIRGAGMDRTILMGRWSELVQTRENTDFENLVIRDLTLDGSDRGAMLLEVRGRLAAALENVRVRGSFSAGHSATIGVSGSAYFGARGCEFIGGEGMFVLSIRGTTLAVFERCRFADVKEAVVGPGGAGAVGSAVRLLDCTYENCAVASRRMEIGSGKLAVAVAVRGGTVALGAPDLDEESRRNSWGAPYVASAEGVAFGPSKPSCTLAEILSVLDRVGVGGSEAVYGAKWLGSTKDGEPRLGLRILDRANGAQSWRVVGPDGVDAEKSPRNPGGGWNAPREMAPESIALAAAVRVAEIPASTAADEVALVVAGSGETAVLHLCVKTSAVGWPAWTTEAATGKLLSGGPARK